MAKQQTKQVTVRRKDITLVEEVEYVMEIGQSVGAVDYRSWRAVFNGCLSTGEEVFMERQSPHAGEALTLLEEAIVAEGWVLK